MKPVWPCGFKRFRDCQRLIVGIRNCSWPAIQGEHFIVKYQRGDEAAPGW